MLKKACNLRGKKSLKRKSSVDSNKFSFDELKWNRALKCQNVDKMSTRD